MASRTICVAAIAVLAVFCGITDAAPSDSERSCNEDDFLKCLERNTGFLTEETEPNDIPALIKKICGVKEKPCTAIHPLEKCPEDIKTRTVALEKSLEETFDALCEKDATLLKELSKTLECWRYDAFVSCVETINVTSPGLDFLTPKRSPKDWDNFNAELPKCIDRARYESEECKGADVRPVKKVIDTFFAYSKRRPNNASGATSAASALTAFASLFVCLVFSRQS